MKKLIIIGGSDAGISAAIRAKEIDPAAAVTIVVADRFPNFSICGLPFYVSGEVKEWQALAHRTIEDIEKQGISLLLEHRVEVIDPTRQTITVKATSGQKLTLEYDKLLIATGAESTRPPIKGIDLPGVFLLRFMEEGIALRNYLTQNRSGSVVIVGGGYIGLEMADAFTMLGLKVTVIEYAETVLTTLDPELSRRVEETLGRHGVNVITRTPVSAIEQAGERLRVIGKGDFFTEADVVLVAAGAKPNVGLSVSAGVDIGNFGAIRVNKAMETNVPHIFAAGDCGETWHRVLGKYTYMPLGTTAHKQGRVAGENMASGKSKFQGSLGTQVVKVFDLIAARTGLRDKEALAAGYDPITTEFEAWDHKFYYPGAKKLLIRLTGDRKTRRLLGAQMLDHYGSEISKRVDVIATAIFNGMKIEALSDLDLSYTPPLSSPWDPLQAAAQEWLKKRSGPPLFA